MAKQVRIKATQKIISQIESWAPDGWVFFRASYAHMTVMREKRLLGFVRRVPKQLRGVEIGLCHKSQPVEPPALILKEQYRDLIQSLSAGGRFIRADFGQGKRTTLLEFEGGNLELPDAIARPMFDLVAQRRSKRMGLTVDELKKIRDAYVELPQVLMPPGGGRPTDTILYVMLQDKEVRELFNLGSNVEVRGVRGEWQGEPIVGRGICTGFSIRCVER